MSQINFAGWLLQDSEGHILPIVANSDRNVCDSCGAAGKYDILIPNLSGNGVGSCQACLDLSYEDPRSPDTFFAPVPLGTAPVVYSDGGQQLTINL